MKKLLVAILFLATNIACAHSKKLNILVGINPIYSLVKNVTGNYDNVDLLVNPNVSPHQYQLKPSDVKKLKKADVIFIVDKHFENFLSNYLSSNHLKAKVVELSHADGIKTLPSRNIKVIDTAHEHSHHHDHHEHEHDHDDHHHHHEGCNHHSIDLHLWTDIGNAEKMVSEIAKTLSQLNPEHSHIYMENSYKTNKKLDRLDQGIRKILDQKTQESSFIVFHDAYQYLENRYNLQNAGAVAGSNFIYGPKTLKDLISRIQKNNIKCIFAEPQFSSDIIKRISRTTSTKAGYLDIEGGSFGNKIDAQDLYFFMMKQNALNIRDCVGY